MKKLREIERTFYRAGNDFEEKGYVGDKSKHGPQHSVRWALSISS